MSVANAVLCVGVIAALGAHAAFLAAAKAAQPVALVSVDYVKCEDIRPRLLSRYPGCAGDSGSVSAHNLNCGDLLPVRAARLAECVASTSGGGGASSGGGSTSGGGTTSGGTTSGGTTSGGTTSGGTTSGGTTSGGTSASASAGPGGASGSATGGGYSASASAGPGGSSASAGGTSASSP